MMGLKDKNKIRVKQKNKRKKKAEKLADKGKDPSNYYYDGVYIGERKE